MVKKDDQRYIVLSLNDKEDIHLWGTIQLQNASTMWWKALVRFATPVHTNLLMRIDRYEIQPKQTHGGEFPDDI